MQTHAGVGGSRDAHTVSWTPQGCQAGWARSAPGGSSRDRKPAEASLANSFRDFTLRARTDVPNHIPTRVGGRAACTHWLVLCWGPEISPCWVAPLSGALSATKRSRVRFPVSARAWVAGSVPGWGTYERQPIDVSFSHRCLSLSPSLSLKSISMSSHKYELRAGTLDSPFP